MGNSVLELRWIHINISKAVSVYCWMLLSSIHSLLCTDIWYVRNIILFYVLDPKETGQNPLKWYIRGLVLLTLVTLNRFIADENVYKYHAVVYV